MPPLTLLALLAGSPALADGLSVQAAWRPTLRRAYIFYGADDRQIPLGKLLVGAEPEPEAGLANDAFEPGRFEASLRYALAENLELYTQVLGGPFRLRFYDQDTLHAGSDWSMDLGGSITTPLGEDLRFQTVMAGRVRVWALGDPVPVHGNVGIVLGVKPEFRGFSLYTEATLSAVWLTDLTAWGAQKDSSILRIRPEYTWRHGALSLSTGLDYYHTHTELFGTELIPGEEAFMLDDFDLALVLGVGWRL